MREAKLKPIFRGLTVAMAGELGGQWTENNIARWVRLRDGAFSYQIDASVTHLLCSADEFKKRGARVKAALKKRLLPEAKFSLQSPKRERERARRAARIAKGRAMAERAVDPNMYRVYSDSTFFDYSVKLLKDDGERGLYESHALPRLYWFVAKFIKKKGSPPQYYRPSPTAGLFAREFALFQIFFRIKTGVPWPHRLVGSAVAAARDKIRFQYEVPTRGKPIGWVPPEFVPAAAPEPAVAVATADVSSATAAASPTNTPHTATPNTAGPLQNAQECKDTAAAAQTPRNGPEPAAAVDVAATTTSSSTNTLVMPNRCHRHQPMAQDSTLAEHSPAPAAPGTFNFDYNPPTDSEADADSDDDDDDDEGSSYVLDDEPAATTVATGAAVIAAEWATGREVIVLD
ncbi:hypothetical protein B0T26DRAFT_674697 [Lasiosphaeria miniovina]|uniref:Uncharacterized protein n=1 Tax=Lasiosphaeria miniovina TaxID=1954250 RepID=A0AA40AW71_9PEZI|nr:uncharacterized protein B0T26DRAFT_674697 [Lasiosphaeria miniovina]KAK0723083.1 hypothetical protein B0T26DRAFT_674697 [Lasiosphaeria miniovina]